MEQRGGRWLAVVALGSVLAACGGDGPSGPGGGGGGNGTFRATINGAAWVAEAQFIQAPTPQKQGHYPLYGARTAGTTLNGITLNLIGISGPGTYPLGTSGGVAGGTATVNEASSVWMTPLSGAAGTVTLTTVTATRAAGTFSFTAEGVVGTAGTRTVTNGQFDIPLNRPANLPAMTHADTGSMTATIGGTAWVGASGGGGAPTGGTLLVIFTGTTRTVSVAVSPYNGPGTYQLNTPNTFHRVSVTAGTVAGSPCCWGGRTQVVNGQIVSLDVGSITITTATANRIRGTFSGTLAPALTGGATANLTVANGTFSYGFP